MKTVLSFIDWYLPGYRAGGTLKAFANQVSHFNQDYKFKIIYKKSNIIIPGLFPATGDPCPEQASH